MSVHISSPSNPLVKRLAALKQRKHRTATGQYLIEGTRELTSAVRGDRVAMEQLVLCPDLAGSAARLLAEDGAARGTEVITLSSVAFSKISMRQNPDGIAALASGGFWTLDELAPGPAPFVVTDGLEKPGNLGAIVRTADAFGIAAVVATGEGIDITNPNLIRSSQGSVFSIPVVEAPRAVALEWLAARGVALVAGSPDGSLDLWEADLGGNVALCVGSEHRGVSPELRAAALLVRIPMAGFADSLNTSVAAAMLVYEAVRQRSVP